MTDTVEEAGTSPELAETQRELWAEREMRTLLEESYADLEALYRDDVGWRRLGEESTRFTQQGRRRIAALADLSATGNALIKKGVGLRTAYIWGQGVDVTIRDDGKKGQDVNAVWRAFWDEPSNRREFTSSEAQSRYERKLATGGEAFWALPTDRVTGRVWVRRIPSHEVVDRICDPEDAAQVWFYKRVWDAVKIDPNTGARSTVHQITYYPALGFYPPSRPASYGSGPQSGEIRWDAPMRPVTVNCPDEDWRGLGDVLPALPWARMDKEFLEDLAAYMRALTRILGQVTGRNSKAARDAAQALRDAATRADHPAAPPGAGAGQWAATDPNTTLSMVSKSGAQISSESHRPLATMVAAALEVPLTMLLGDPGITGARATAETLDQPTELTFGLRQAVHEELFRDVAGYVIDQAVIAPRGPLRGSVAKDGNRLVVTLPTGDERTVHVDWPEFDSTPLAELVTAIVEADTTETLPKVEIFKLLAQAFGLEPETIAQVIEDHTDEDGNWISPTTTAGQVAVDQFRAGGDAAQVN
jgi:hypothetical protein